MSVINKLLKENAKQTPMQMQICAPDWRATALWAGVVKEVYDLWKRDLSHPGKSSPEQKQSPDQTHSGERAHWSPGGKATGGAVYSSTLSPALPSPQLWRLRSLPE